MSLAYRHADGRVFHFGRRRPDPERSQRWTLGARTLRDALTPLGSPPATCSWSAALTKAVGQDLGMMGNDSEGDCAEAGEGHLMMARTANAGGGVFTPTRSDVEALYTAVTGWNPSDPSTDEGTDVSSLEDYLVKNGWLGHQPTGTAPIDPTDLSTVRWATFLFGGAPLGILVPRYAMLQFANGQPWDVDPSGDQSVVGGHLVPAVDYDSGSFGVVTWGRLQTMTVAFFSKWGEEAHGTVWRDWIETAGVAPSGLDLTDLEARLRALPAAA